MSLIPQIRAALPSDAPRLAALASQLGYPAGADSLLSRLEAVYADPRHAVFVAEDCIAGVIGWAHVGRRPSLLSEPDAELFAMIVEESHRGRGTGRALVAAAEDWARAQGCPTLRVRSNVVRSEAHEFYRRLGYQVSKRQDVFDKAL